mmetsp:Transcript_7386/g.16183  ORF Transcript_7386/g.16183 Transcript_7386/m.16183 type:complete len:862 (-) Transcript_7386:140-2725(-)
MRTAPLNELITNQRHCSTASLTEVFSGYNRPDALAASATYQVQKPRPTLPNGLRPNSAGTVARSSSLPSRSFNQARPASSQQVNRPGSQQFPRLPSAGPGPTASAIGSSAAQAERVNQALIVYMRLRQMAQSSSRGGQRVPQKITGELRDAEVRLREAIRPVCPHFFQRLSEDQLGRLIRSMQFLRLQRGRWLYGSNKLQPDASWPEPQGSRLFMLLYGTMHLFESSEGIGEHTTLDAFEMLGPEPVKLADEDVNNIVAQSAYCHEACTVGVLESGTFEVAFSDRAFGNQRIAQAARNSSTLCWAVTGEAKKNKQEEQAAVEAGFHNPMERNAAKTALKELARQATLIHLGRGELVESASALDDNIFMVLSGSLEVRGSVSIRRKVQTAKRKPLRAHITVVKGEKLIGDTIFDRLDPYAVVGFSETNRFQTTMQGNAGANPDWRYQGVLGYHNEEELTVRVMDKEVFTNDTLVGIGSIPVTEILGKPGAKEWKGKVQLFRPKRGVLQDVIDQENAGWVHLVISWDYKEATMLSKPWHVHDDKTLFIIQDQETWGLEQMVLGEKEFIQTLERSVTYLEQAAEAQDAAGDRFEIKLGSFSLFGAEPPRGSQKSEVAKISRRRFFDLVNVNPSKKLLASSCRSTAMRRSEELAVLLQKLYAKQETIERIEYCRRGGLADQMQEEQDQAVGMDPSRFRVAFNGCKMHLDVRNALNLSGGGWFDKLDPYAVIKLRGAKGQFRTSVMTNAGSDPIWNCQGFLRYGGETHLDVAVFDYDRIGNDDLLGSATLPIERFYQGFEGSISLDPPDNNWILQGRQRGKAQKMQLVMGISFDPPAELEETLTSRKNLNSRSLNISMAPPAVLAA